MKLHTLLIFLLFSAKQYFVVGDDSNSQSYSILFKSSSSTSGWDIATNGQGNPRNPTIEVCLWETIEITKEQT